MAERKTTTKAAKVSKVETPTAVKKAPASRKAKASVAEDRAAKRPASVQASPAPPKLGAKSGVSKGTSTAKKPESASIVTPGVDRMRMVAEAAYYRAERRGFVGGWEQQDWLEAEAEIDRLMGK